MEGNPQAERPRLGEAAIGLMTAAGMNRSLAQLRVGADAIGRRSLETSDVLATFLARHAEIAEGFAARAGLSLDDLTEALRTERTPEPQPEPMRLPENPTDEQRQTYHLMKPMEDERLAKGEAAPFSGPVKQAQRVAKREALARGEARIGVGRLTSALIESEGHAREAVASLVDPARLTVALDWLRLQADPPERGAICTPEEIRAKMRRTVDAAWEATRVQQEAAQTDEARRRRDEIYEKNPARYEEPIDIAAELAEEPPFPDQAYLWRAGICRRAAENEARIRHAPEATLDHLLVALLRDGTDTAAFLDARGVDRADWSRRLDAALPRHTEGPRWPPTDRALGMGQPDNLTMRLIKPVPEGVRLRDLPREERLTYIESVPDPDKRFTDLLYASKFPDEPQTFGHGLFAEAGIAADALKAETIARERDDPEWWRKPPSLVADLEEARRSPFVSDMACAHACEEAAIYEARMRGSAKVEFDDLLVALLVPGTDLWTLLNDLGRDAAALRERIAALRPRGEGITMFPERTDPPIRIMALAKEGFSDLLFLRLRPLVQREPFPGLRQLREVGVTEEAVARRLTELGLVPLGGGG